MTRIVDFTDGFSSATAPSTSGAEAASLQQFANDAAYVSNKGAAAENGDIYYNTTDHVVRVYANSAWREESTVVKSAVTISDTTESSSKDTGSLILEGGLGVEKNVHVGGNVVITGNATVNGSITTVNSTTLDVADSNITVNKGGNQSSADLNDAGLTVEMSDATDAVIHYDSTATSKFKVGESGSTVEIATISGSQVITNKDIDGGTASNTNRITLPKNTKANLDALNRKEATLVYSSDEDKVYYDNGSELKAVGAGGVGSFSIFETFNADDDSFNDWTESAGTWAEETVSHLSGAKSYKWTPNAANDTLDSPSVTLPKRTLDLAGYSPCMVEFAYDASNDGFQAIILDNSSNVLATSDIDSTKNRIQILFNLTGSETSLKLRIKDQTHTASMNIVFDDITFDDAPFRKIDVSPDTEWTSYTPTFTGFGTVSTQSFYYRRSGDSIEVSGYFISGTSTATAAKISLPSGLLIDTAKIATGTTSLGIIIGNMIRDAASTSVSDFSVLYGGDTNEVYMSPTNNSGNSAMAAQNGDYFANSGDEFSLNFKVPISGWSSYNESVLVENADGSEWTDAGAMTITGESGNPSKGTVAVDKVRWRRDGTDLIATYTYRQTAAGSSGTGQYYYALPASLQADTTKVSADSNTSQSTNLQNITAIGYGFATLGDNSTNASIVPVLHDSTRIKLFIPAAVADDGTSANASGDFIGQPEFGLQSSNTAYSFSIRVPIVGWSSVQAHIMDIADPYENTYSATISSSGGILSTSKSGWITGVSKTATGRYTITMQSGLFNVVPSIQLTFDGAGDANGARSAYIRGISTTTTFYVGLDSSGAADAPFTVIATRQGADYREPKGYFIGQSVPMRIAYLNMTTYGYNFHGSGSTTSYKSHSFASVSGDSFVSVNGTDITLQAGKYEISYGVAGNGNTQWVHSDIYNSTDASVIEEFSNVSYNELSTTVTFNTVFTTIELTATKVINIRTKSSNVGSGETISRPKITKVK